MGVCTDMVPGYCVRRIWERMPCDVLILGASLSDPATQVGLPSLCGCTQVPRYGPASAVPS